jgi:hypothetical protein
VDEVTYPEFYGEVFAALARPLTAADHIPEEEIAANEQRLGVKLPDALRVYYAVAGNMRRLNEAYNRLLAPADWRIERRVLVFLAENQGVVRWGVPATRSRRTDPAVVYSVADGQSERSDWAREELDCSDFLVLMLCWQAVHGGMPHTGWAQVPSAVGEAVADRWDSEWRSRDLRAYYRPGQALCLTGPSRPPASSGARLDLLAGGRSEAEFGRLVQELVALGVSLEVYKLRESILP